MDVSRRSYIRNAAGLGLLALTGCMDFGNEPNISVQVVNSTQRPVTLAVIITSENENPAFFHGSTTVERSDNQDGTPSETTFDDRFGAFDTDREFIVRLLLDDGTVVEESLNSANVDSVRIELSGRETVTNVSVSGE